MSDANTIINELRSLAGNFRDGWHEQPGAAEMLDEAADMIQQLDALWRHLHELNKTQADAIDKFVKAANRIGDIMENRP